ncbi:MAG: hypothetical protein L0332_05385 [Chloroflexi bacterium]|nr:hypothetical protein [Chloroflexota bacterium]MCI0579925.1 hypothetical protein [Chloroflexota bacterium]MCI0646508.1 hypothetical protein [Chloroflexota bacterium]MCI0726140.1 hypothetical protein [Chloroflexota bacterium]
MVRKISSTKVRLGAIVLLAFAVLAVAGSGVSAGDGCDKVKGTFTLEPVSGPTCTSSVGICAAGTYTGDLAGTAFFTGTSLIATVDTPTTSVVFLTGDNLFQTPGGQLTTKDAIALQTTGQGKFTELDTVIAGTGEWAGATGSFRANGTFNTTTGGEGNYLGEICFP